MRWVSAITSLAVCGVLACSPAYSQSATTGAAPLTADAIMARVGANQDRSELARKQYVYRQHIHVVTRKTNGKLMREETTDYHMVPQAGQNSAATGEADGQVLGKREVRRVQRRACAE